MGPKLEDFEVLSTIGSGAHGTVRKVRRRQDGQILVWKELNYGAMGESEKQGLVLEVNLLRELRHPNIVKFLHHIVDRRSTTLYILMEYCPGGDLKHLISKCHQTSTFLEEGFIWRVLKQICEALKVCHTRQLRKGPIILHRDIKPANVFLDADGEVKLGDFGLARTLNSEASFATTFVGTPYYMSPEVIEGQDYNEKSDMWSLGCLIYELCALHPPFQATTHKQLAAKIKEARYERIPIQYSNALQEVLGFLLTYEDFLRPTALVVLHHSALVAHTASKKDRQGDDPLYHSLSHRVLLSAGNQPKKLEVVQDIEVSKEENDFETGEHEEEMHQEGKGENSNEIPKNNAQQAKESECSTNSRKLKVDKCSRDETQTKHTKINSTYLMAETYRISKNEDFSRFSDEEHKLLPYQNKLVNSEQDQDSSSNFHLPQETPKLPLKKDQTESALENTIEKICRAARNVGQLPDRGCSKVQEGICDMNFAKLECACGGMSLKSWRERVLALREAEIAVREREMALKEREREASHREHRVAAMEREAREHLVRAQIYLRQSRPRQNAATSPHRPPSDLDTTMSADVSDDIVKTTTKLDPQRIDNPFLKMRGIQPPGEKRVSFKEKPTKFKSNTLDNPKSRQKRGNIFRLVSSEPKTETKDKLPDETNIRGPLRVISDNASTAQQQGQSKKSLDSPHQPASLLNPDKKLQVTVKSSLNCILRERPRSTENLGKKSNEAVSGKENVSQALKLKKVPEIKPGLWSRRSGRKFTDRPGRREQVVRSQDHVMQYYNVV